MSNDIHVMKTRSGRRFRIWSTVSRTYITGEMSMKQLYEYLTKMAVCEAIGQCIFETGIRIDRATIRGTSNLQDVRDPNGPWNKDRK